uniref:Uncharacterized protein n=1 Tax=Arundo donax TaxID=35708 RepID=A0A0A9FDW0_ARUDO
MLRPVVVALHQVQELREVGQQQRVVGLLGHGLLVSLRRGCVLG